MVKRESGNSREYGNSGKHKKSATNGPFRREPISWTVHIPSGVDPIALAKAVGKPQGEAYKPDRIALLLSFMVAVVSGRDAGQSTDYVTLDNGQLRELLRNPAPVIRLLEQVGVIESLKSPVKPLGTRTGGKSYRIPGPDGKGGLAAQYRLLPPFSEDLATYRLTDRWAIGIYFRRVHERLRFKGGHDTPLSPNERRLLAARWKARTERHSSREADGYLINIKNISTENIDHYYVARCCESSEKAIHIHSGGGTPAGSDQNTHRMIEQEYFEIFGEDMFPTDLNGSDDSDSISQAAKP